MDGECEAFELSESLREIVIGLFRKYKIRGRRRWHLKRREMVKVGMEAATRLTENASTDPVSPA